MNRSPIGVIDSGIGGLTVLRRIVANIPNESTVYIADSANCPYGTKNFEQIVALTESCVNVLQNYGVKIVVLACNTMTAAAIEYLREKYEELIFVGMEPAVKPAAALTQSGVVGILATQATLSGEHYHRTVGKIDKNIEIIEQAGNGLVELIEQGREDSQECYELTKSYIDPMMKAGADCLVLGCTHYPFLEQTISHITSGRMTLINPAPAVAKRVQTLLRDANMLNDSDNPPQHIYLTSGDESALEVIRSRVIFAPGEIKSLPICKI